MLQKAMVFTLSAAMLVGTPLTASAAPLNEVYKVTDSWGGTKDQNGENDTRTGTVTSTETNSGALKADSKILGISLSETNVELEMDGAYNPNNKVTTSLTVSIDWDGEEDAKLEKKIMNGLVWRTGDRDIVALQALGKKEEVQLTAKAGGKTTVTVSLDSSQYNIHYTATANVNVEQWATGLSFKGLGEDAYDGASLKLDDYLVKDPATATDKVTYVIKEDKDKVATLKNGVLTLKENTKTKIYDGKEVIITAVGKNVKHDEKITIRKGVHATKVTIVEGTTEIGKKDDWLVNTKGVTREFGVKLETGTSEKCTDKVTWTSQKPGVVALEKNGEDGVKLTARSVGSSKITAKAGKKSAVVTVTVRANLTGIDITTKSGELYSGQTIQLTADQKFAANGVDNFIDAGLNWVFDATGPELNAMKNAATLNAKTGVLTIKPDVTGAPDIKIKAQNAKAIGKKGDDASVIKKAKNLNSNSVTFKLKQINVTSITVYSNMSETTAIAGAALSGTGTKAAPKDLKKDFGKANTVNIANGTSRTYKVVVTAADDNGNSIDPATAQKVLTWTSGKPAFATAAAGDGSGTVSAIKKGKSTITVSSATKNGKGKYVAIKATFNANVTAPTKSITLSVKNLGIACKYGKSNAIAAQNVKVTAKLDKGTTSKTSEIKWSAVKVGDSTNTNLMKKDKKGNATNTLALEAGKYAAGDKYIVTASLPGTGVKTNITLTVVEPTNKVQIVQSVASNEKYDKNTKTIAVSGDDSKFTLVTKVQKKGDSDWTVAGEKNYATVSYTVKGDCVQIVGNEVRAVKTGNATITAKTSDGKTATLKVKVQ